MSVIINEIEVVPNLPPQPASNSAAPPPPPPAAPRPEDLAMIHERLLHMRLRVTAH
jgi:hypothetical protein